jgi:hypothetical protein
LLCHFQSIIDFDAKVSHRAFQFGVPKQELNGTQIAGLAV